MPKKILRIIGINPGTRYIGVAVFQGSELLDWGVKSVGGRWSVEKMKKARMILSDLLQRYEPDVIAIKELHPSRSSRNLNHLVKEMKELARRRGLRIYQYPIKEMERFFHSGKMSKRKLAESVASQHPVLAHELNREKTINNPYYIRMFEAVALGSVCLHQLDGSCIRRDDR
jgi:Holliday junction resolvasome RuvABC endonuclease subunit